MRQIVRDGIVLATYIPAQTAWRPGLNFFSADGDFVQVGTWGYDAGKVLARHAHNRVTRAVTHTQEVLLIRRGRLRADIYDAAGVLAEQVEAGPGDLLVLLNGGHGYEVLEDGTEVLEIKNGPYPGADLDRTRF